MIEARASARLPVPAREAFEVVSDVTAADWLPAIRGVRHVGGPRSGVGARFEVETGLVGRHLRGILRVEEMTPPRHMVLVLEEGLDLTVVIDIAAARPGCTLTMTARYSVGGAFGGAVERATQGPARREVARALEQLSARFARDAEPPTKRR